MSVIRPALSVTLLACVVGSAAAVECEATKLGTEDAAPIDPGTYELDLGYSYATAKGAFDSDGTKQSFDSGKATEHALGMAVKAGIKEGLDVTVSAGYVRAEDSTGGSTITGSGLTNMAISAKWLFFEKSDDQSRIGVALIPNVGIPLGDNSDSQDIATRSDVWAPGLMLATNNWYGEFTWNADLGYNRSIASAEKRGGVVGTWVADVAIGWQVSCLIQPEVELNYSKNTVDAGHDDSWSLAGIAGVELCLNPAVVSLGVQQTLAGKNTANGTALLAAVAIGF